MKKVSDPALLAQLEGQSSARVTDPALLALLEGQTAPAYNPTEGNSFIENAWQSFGGTLPNLALRTKQLFAGSPDINPEVFAGPHKSMAPGPERDAALQRIQQERQAAISGIQSEIDEMKRLEKPLMNTGGGMVGRIIGTAGVGAPLLAVPGANTLVGSGLVGAGMGLTEPVASDESGAENAGLGLLGGGLGYAAGKALGAVATPIKSRLGKVATGVADYAKRLGIDLSPAQATGSRALHALESAMDYLPFTSGKQTTRRIANNKVFNRELAQTFGENTDTITPETIRTASDRIGNVFRDISKRNTVAADAKFMKDIEAVKKEYSRTLDSSKRQILYNYIDDILKTADKGARVNRGGGGKHLKGFIPGEKYQTFRSQLSSQGDAASDVYFGRALKGIRGALDDAMERSVSETDAAAWQVARKQWQAMKTVKPLAEKAIDGNVSPALLLERVRANYPDLTKTGDMSKLAELGQTFLKQPIGDSGTAQRLLFQNMLTGGGLGVGAGGLTYGATQDPAAAAAAAAAFFGGPRAMQKLYYSQPARRYLGRGLLDPQHKLLTRGPESLGLLGAGSALTVE